MNSTIDLTNCNTITAREQEFVEYCNFWVGGVSACCIGILGVVLNLGAICILPARVTKKNNFNQLITSLFVFDTIFLLLNLGEVLDRSLGFANRTYTILFPKLLYPLRSCSMTASIFMTV